MSFGDFRSAVQARDVERTATLLAGITGEQFDVALRYIKGNFSVPDLARFYAAVGVQLTWHDPAAGIRVGGTVRDTLQALDAYDGVLCSCRLRGTSIGSFSRLDIARALERAVLPTREEMVNAYFWPWADNLLEHPEPDLRALGPFLTIEAARAYHDDYLDRLEVCRAAVQAAIDMRKDFAEGLASVNQQHDAAVIEAWTHTAPSEVRTALSALDPAACRAIHAAALAEAESQYRINAWYRLSHRQAFEQRDEVYRAELVKAHAKTLERFVRSLFDKEAR